MLVNKSHGMFCWCIKFVKCVYICYTLRMYCGKKAAAVAVAVVVDFTKHTRYNTFLNYCIDTLTISAHTKFISKNWE